MTPFNWPVLTLWILAHPNAPFLLSSSSERTGGDLVGMADMAEFVFVKSGLALEGDCPVRFFRKYLFVLFLLCISIILYQYL